MVKRAFVLAMIAVLVLGCSRSAERPASTENVMPNEAPAPSAAPVPVSVDNSSAGVGEDLVKAATIATPATEKIPARIIRNATVRFQVIDYGKARAEIERQVKAQNGYISSERETNDGYNLENNLVIRVESAKFDPLLDRLTALAAYLQEKTVTAQDVTAEFVDVQARLRTKKDVAERYREILGQARDIPDVLAVEKELRTLQEEIEATEGRLRYLSDQVAYSTITLTFFQKLDHQPEPTPGFFSDMLQAVRGGWQLVLNIALGLVYAWPLVLVVAGLVLWIRRIIRRKRAARAAAAAAK